MKAIVQDKYLPALIVAAALRVLMRGQTFAFSVGKQPQAPSTVR
jgi:hypothetical protein